MFACENSLPHKVWLLFSVFFFFQLILCESQGNKNEFSVPYSKYFKKFDNLHKTNSIPCNTFKHTFFFDLYNINDVFSNFFRIEEVVKQIKFTIPHPSKEEYKKRKHKKKNYKKKSNVCQLVSQYFVMKYCKCHFGWHMAYVWSVFDS